MTLVFTRNERLYRQWVRSAESAEDFEERRATRRVRTLQDIQGVEVSEIIYLDGWERMPDAFELSDLAEARKQLTVDETKGSA